MNLIIRLPPPPPLIVVRPSPNGYELSTSGLWMPIVQSAFQTFFTPGLKKSILALSDAGVELLSREIERADKMAILHPDTSKVPIWRRPAKRMEHPITAWRCWDIRFFSGSYHLRSAAVDCIWEGPVMRAHKRPVDPKYWDAKKPKAWDKNVVEKTIEYYSELRDTFELAGIWAVKTRELAEETARAYSVSCIGEIHLWGRVAQFELGYRAEVCMIKRLFLTGAHGRRYNSEGDVAPIIRDLSRRYGCEVTFA